MALSLITFSPGTVIKSSDVNSNFNALNVELFDIDQTNFNPAAQLPDSLLATISTGGKVNGSAIVSQSIDAVKGQFLWALPGDLVAGTDASFRLESSAVLTIIGAYARCKTAPVGSTATIDIHKNATTGASVFSGGNILTINDGANEDNGNHVIGTTSLAVGDWLTVEIINVGSTTPAANLTVGLLCEQKVPQ